MFKKILVPVDLAEPELAKPAIETAIAMARSSQGSLRIVNVLPMTPVMLAEYVPPDFDLQQRKSAEDGLKKLVEESGLDASRVSRPLHSSGFGRFRQQESALDRLSGSGARSRVRERTRPRAASLPPS